MRLTRGPLEELDNGDWAFRVVVPKAERLAFLRRYPERLLDIGESTVLSSPVFPVAGPESRWVPPPGAPADEGVPQFLSADGIASGGFGATTLPLSELEGRICTLIANPQFQAYGMRERQIGTDQVPDAEDFAAVFLQELVGKPLDHLTEVDVDRVEALFREKSA